MYKTLCTLSIYSNYDFIIKLISPENEISFELGYLQIVKLNMSKLFLCVPEMLVLHILEI